MIVVVFVEKHWSSSRRRLAFVGKGVGADDGMMVGWGVGAAVGTSDGIDEDGIDEGAVVGSTVVPVPSPGLMRHGGRLGHRVHAPCLAPGASHSKLKAKFETYSHSHSFTR